MKNVKKEKGRGSSRVLTVSESRLTVCLPLNIAASIDSGSRSVSVSTVVAYVLPPVNSKLLINYFINLHWVG